MDALEPPNWTLSDHLSAGYAALEEISRDRAHTGPEPICHHFDERDPVDPITVSVEDTYRDLCPRFQEIGLEFLADRLEAWETATPTRSWLEKRISAILETVEQSRLYYRGWTWEPRDRQPIAASDITIINNRTS